MVQEKDSLGQRRDSRHGPCAPPGERVRQGQPGGCRGFDGGSPGEQAQRKRRGEECKGGGKHEHCPGTHGRDGAVRGAKRAPFQVQADAC